MIHVADLDLLAPDSRLPTVGGELHVLLWAGDEVLGAAWIRRYSPLRERGHREALAERFHARVYALQAVRAKAEQERPAPSSVSLVVSTRSRAAAAACLRHVEALDPAPGEVLTCRWGAGRGLAGARNAGWQAARGELIAFLTDACHPDPRYVAALCRAFAPSQVAAVSGLVAPAELYGYPQIEFELQGALNKGFERRLYHRETGAPPATALIGTGVSFSFRRAALEAVGGFDESLGPGTPIGAGEDLDALSRLLDAGSVVAHEPSAVVRHVHPRTRASLLAFVRAAAAGLAVHRAREIGPRTALGTAAATQLAPAIRAVGRRDRLRAQIALQRVAGARQAVRVARPTRP